MKSIQSRIVDEMTVFADLGTEGASGAQRREGFVVRLVRHGDELALVFPENGDGEVIERCRSGKRQTYPSYLALLASERFGNLGAWAATQKMLLREVLADMQTGIRVQGAMAGCDDLLTADELNGFLQSAERCQDSVHVLLIDGPAGIGKTKFIEALALARAADYRHQRHPLVLHVESRGRVLSYLQDLIAFSLQRLRLSVTFDQLPVLARHGLVTLAIDGFDELGDPNGYELAWSQVNETIGEIRGAGTLILAGRETFIGLSRLKSALPVLKERDIVHGLTLRPPTPKVAGDWLQKKGWSKADVKNADALLDADSYALRPFFLGRLAEPDMAKSLRESAGTSLLAILVDKMVERESGKFGDAVDRVLSPEQRLQYAHRFLREAAQYMADDQTDIIGETPLTWLVDMAAPESLDPDTTGLLKNRAGVMAFLANDDLPGYRRFAHSQLFNYFLSAAAIEAVGHGETPKFVKRNIFSADFLTVLVEVIRNVARVDPGLIEMFFDNAHQWVKSNRSIDRGARNLGAWIIAALPTMAGIRDDSDTIRIGPVEVDETILRGTSPRTTLQGVFINQLDIRGADVRDLMFEESVLTTVIVDEGTRVSRTFPAPQSLGRTHDGFDRDPSSIGDWLDVHGRVTATDEVVPNPDGRHGLMLRLVERACRNSSFWIPETAEGTVDRFVKDPLWPDVLRLLKAHDFIREDVLSASGRKSRFVHIRQSGQLLANDPKDRKVARFYEALANAAV